MIRPTRITRLALRDFRNLAEVALSPGGGITALVGDNGAGKTNLLEAVSLLAPGRGLRGAAFGAMARHGGAGGFAMTADVDAGGPITLAVGTVPAAPERRQVRVNGATASAQALGEWLSLIWITPAMDRLWSEPASARRRFLDRLTLALEPGHGVHATRYDAAARARLRLLSGDARPDPAWLTALEIQMADHGSAVVEARARTVEALRGGIAASPDDGFPRATVTLAGEVGDADELRHALARSRAADAAAGRTTVGPSRQDLAVTHAAKNIAAALGSTGEQKALLLGLVLAHAGVVAGRTGAAPVLLLDEVAAHLDPARREALWARLGTGPYQALLTGTDAPLFAGLPADSVQLTVAAGAVR